MQDREKFFVLGVAFHAREGRHFLLGDNVLLSYGINMWNGDEHTVFDAEKRALNPARDIVIGNKVWIGHQVELFTGAGLADNSVVGACSLVDTAFAESNVVIAGQPARIVKRGITWDYKAPLEVLSPRD
jgi:acetyltransferase-like isoleucine patch superfamily enzyme